MELMALPDLCADHLVQFHAVRSVDMYSGSESLYFGLSLQRSGLLTRRPVVLSGARTSLF